MSRVTRVPCFLVIFDLPDAEYLCGLLNSLNRVNVETTLTFKDLLNFAFDENKPFEVKVPGWFTDNDEREYTSSLCNAVYHLARATLPLSKQTEFLPVATGAEVHVPSETICIWLGDPNFPIDGNH